MVINIKETLEYSNWGAEAFLIKDSWFGFTVIRKVRPVKEYRIPQIDKELRRARTILESRLLIAAKNAGVRTPYVYSVDIENTTIIMEYIEGIQMKELLYRTISENEKFVMVEEIGKELGKLHFQDIIHGDITTSNIVVCDNRFVFLDFGLGKISKAVEDKAVDLLLIKKCFTSTHTDLAKQFFLKFQEGYANIYDEAKKVIKRAIRVESRARHLKEQDVIADYLSL